MASNRMLVLSYRLGCTEIGVLVQNFLFDVEGHITRDFGLADSSHFEAGLVKI